MDFQALGEASNPLERENQLFKPNNSPFILPSDSGEAGGAGVQPRAGGSGAGQLRPPGGWCCQLAEISAM